MTVLLDTHALLWSIINPRNLSSTATKIIADESNDIVVSAASAWEISTKVRLGKLPRAEAFEQEFLDVLESLAYRILSIDAESALRAGRLIGEHGDPFDRILAAQALALDIPILSKDPKLDQFGVRRIW